MVHLRMVARLAGWCTEGTEKKLLSGLRGLFIPVSKKPALLLEAPLAASKFFIDWPFGKKVASHFRGDFTLSFT